MAAWVISHNPLTVQIVRLSVDSELPVGLNEQSKCLQVFTMKWFFQ